MVGFGLPTVLLFAGGVIGSIVAHAAAPFLWKVEVVVFCLVPTLACGTIVFLGVQCIRNANKMADDNMYVPPAREQIADLPADEVLLRGSDQSAASPDELLRSAYWRSPGSSDMLLRADQRLAGVELARSIKGVSNEPDVQANYG
jgi:hypothetical protein